MPTDRPSLASSRDKLVDLFKGWSHWRASDRVRWGNEEGEEEVELYRIIDEFEYFLKLDVDEKVGSRSFQTLNRKVCRAISELFDLRSDAQAHKLDRWTGDLVSMVESFMYKLMALLEPEEFSSCADKGLLTALTQLERHGRLDTAIIKDTAIRKRVRDFESPAEWSNRSSVEIALRDVFGARQKGSHTAQQLVESFKEAFVDDAHSFHQHRKLWQSVLVLMLSAIDTNREDLIRARLSRLGCEFDAEHMSDYLYGIEINERFCVTGVIGEGGMGRVYSAVQYDRSEKGVKPLKQVAIKSLKTADEQAQKRWDDECKNLTGLEHPNVVTVIDRERDERIKSYPSISESFLVMEFVDGVDLRQLLELGRLKPELALDITYQVCSGLSAIHTKKLVHRDIKPSNIRLTRIGETIHVTLIDLGIALDLSGNRDWRTRTGINMGTPGYMSPEQEDTDSFDELDQLDERSDIYSLGQVFFEMVTGRRFAYGLFPSEFLDGVDKSARLQFDELLVEKMLQFKPERRPKNIRAVMKSLRELRSSFRISDPKVHLEAPPDQGLIEALLSQGLLVGEKPTTLHNTGTHPHRTGEHGESLDQIAREFDVEVDSHELLEEVNTAGFEIEDPHTSLTREQATALREFITDSVQAGIRETSTSKSKVAAKRRTLAEDAVNQDVPETQVPAPAVEEPVPGTTEFDGGELFKPSTDNVNADSADRREESTGHGGLAFEVRRTAYNVFEYAVGNEGLLEGLIPENDLLFFRRARSRLKSALASLLSADIELPANFAGGEDEFEQFRYRQKQRPLLLAPLIEAEELLTDLQKMLGSQQRASAQQFEGKDAKARALVREQEAASKRYLHLMQTRLLRLFVQRKRRLTLDGARALKRRRPARTRRQQERCRLLAILEHRRTASLLEKFQHEGQTLLRQRDELARMLTDVQQLLESVQCVRTELP